MTPMKDETHSDLPQVSRLRATGDLRADIERAVQSIGGWDWLHDNETILVKPNYNSPHPPPGHTTPDFLRAALLLLREHGATSIIVGESPAHLKPLRVFEQVGAVEITREMNIPLVLFDKDGWENVAVGGQYLKRVKLARILRRVNRIVYLCCPKTHHSARFTGSLKLGMGFVNNWRRTLWHLGHLQEKIADLNMVLKPDLVLADMRSTFIKGGPATGEVREPGLLLASQNRVALDIEAIKIIQGFPGHNLPAAPVELAQINRAIDLGLGPREGLSYRIAEL